MAHLNENVSGTYGGSIRRFEEDVPSPQGNDMPVETALRHLFGALDRAAEVQAALAERLRPVLGEPKYPLDDDKATPSFGSSHVVQRIENAANVVDRLRGEAQRILAVLDL
jgi:hypothetical protein